jgi:hypothetical protein
VPSRSGADPAPPGAAHAALALALALGASAWVAALATPPRAGAQEAGQGGRAPGWLAPFVRGLAPHGTFTVLEPLGLVWSPDPAVVGAAFVPYVTHGRWEPSAVGWQFVSDFGWGDLVFHYGRWVADPGLGWVWAPDETWGASWVDWRSDGGVIAWSPRLPDALLGTEAEGRRPWFTAPAAALARSLRALPVVLAEPAWLVSALPCGAWSGPRRAGDSTPEWPMGPDPARVGVAPSRYRGGAARGRLPDSMGAEPAPAGAGTVEVRRAADGPGEVEVRVPESARAALVLRAGAAADLRGAAASESVGGARTSGDVRGGPDVEALLVAPVPPGVVRPLATAVLGASPWVGRGPAPSLAPVSPVLPVAPPAGWAPSAPPAPAASAMASGPTAPSPPPVPSEAPRAGFAAAPRPAGFAPRPSLPAHRAPDLRAPALDGLRAPALRPLGGPR